MFLFRFNINIEPSFVAWSVYVGLSACGEKHFKTSYPDFIIRSFYIFI